MCPLPQPAVTSSNWVLSRLPVSCDTVPLTRRARLTCLARFFFSSVISPHLISRCTALGPLAPNLLFLIKDAISLLPAPFYCLIAHGLCHRLCLISFLPPTLHLSVVSPICRLSLSLCLTPALVRCLFSLCLLFFSSHPLFGCHPSWCIAAGSSPSLSCPTALLRSPHPAHTVHAHPSFSISLPPFLDPVRTIRNPMERNDRIELSVFFFSTPCISQSALFFFFFPFPQCPSLVCPFSGR